MAKQTQKTIGTSAADIHKAINEEVAHLKKIIAQKDAAIEDYRASHGSISHFFRSVEEAIPQIAPQQTMYKPPKGGVSTSPCWAVAHITDGHYGAVQPASEVEGFGEYSPEICRDRQMRYAHKMIDWVELHRKAYRLDECAVLVTGDLISGDIHNELQVTNAIPSPVQVVGAAEILAEQVALLAQHFTQVHVHFITEDNHGRLTKKPQAKEAGLNSMNYLVGMFARVMLKDIANVDFNVYTMYEKSVEVCNRRYLIMHGHNIRGWMGFPYYGVERVIAKEALKRMNGPDMSKFHRVIMGHWHAPLAHPWYWIGGSVSGTDAYDHKAARHAIPSQSAWIVHPKWAEFDRTDFDLR